MGSHTKPTIQEVIDRAKAYARQGIDQQEAIRRAISEAGYRGEDKRLPYK